MEAIVHPVSRSRGYESFQVRAMRLPRMTTRRWMYATAVAAAFAAASSQIQDLSGIRLHWGGVPKTVDSGTPTRKDEG